MRIKLATLLNILIAFLTIVIFIDPTNLIFHIKYVFFASIILIWIIDLFEKRQRQLPSAIIQYVSFISIILPFYGLLLGILNNNIGNNLTYFNSFFFFFLVIILVDKRIEITHIFNLSGLIIAFFTILLYFIILFSPALFSKLYNYLVIEKQVAMLSVREFGGIKLLMIYYKTSPLLVFPLSYCLYNLLIYKKKGILLNSIFVFVFAITLFLSGTRANIVSMIIIILFYFSWYFYMKSKRTFIVYIYVLLFTLLVTLPSFFLLLFNSSEESNLVKFSHAQSYINLFFDTPQILLFGQGLGSFFYSSGYNMLVQNTELTYLEIIRIWGLPFASAFMVILFIPIINFFKRKTLDHIFISYIAYLFISATNPLLISSTGMVCLVYVFSQMIIVNTYE